MSLVTSPIGAIRNALPSRAPGAAFLTSRAAVFLAIVLLALQGSPMLTRSHVEGFSYAIDTAAILLPFAPISMLDPLWPFGGQFYFLTRVATPALAVPFAAMAPGYGFAILSFLASLTLIVALPLLIRRWSGASWLAVVLAVFCVPILIEVNFFLNDNLIASTLFCLAALAALRTKTPAWAALSGTLMAASTLARLDHLLLMPLLLLLVAVDRKLPRDLLLRWGLLLASWAAIQGIAAMIPGADLLSRMHIAAAGTAIWDRPASIVNDVKVLAMACGAGIIVCAVGAMLVVYRAYTELETSRLSLFARFVNLALPLSLIVAPLLAYLPTMGRNYDLRAIMLYAPALASLAAIAIQSGIDLAAGKNDRRLTIALTGVVLALVLAPIPWPGYGLPVEGPKPYVTGRIWQIGQWRAWQAPIHTRDAAADVVISAAAGDAAPALVLTADWTSDRLLQNAAARNGWRPISAPPVCAGFAEAWTDRNGTLLLLLRLHVPFGQPHEESFATIWQDGAKDCARSVPSSRRTAFRLSDNLEKFRILPADGGGSAIHAVTLSAPLEDTDLTALDSAAARLIGCGASGQPVCAAGRDVKAREAALRARLASRVRY